MSKTSTDKGGSEPEPFDYVRIFIGSVFTGLVITTVRLVIDFVGNGLSTFQNWQNYLLAAGAFTLAYFVIFCLFVALHRKWVREGKRIVPKKR